MTDRVLGDVATTPLFENDRVKVWEMVLAPGEESPIHEHRHDYILVQISGDRIAGVPEPDTASPYSEYVEGDVVPGQVVYIPAGGIELARNVGAETYHEILIELK